jgi:putative intracellular protease/amidase
MLAPAVLMVVANQDFYWDEYAKPRAELERAGIHVVVAAAAKGTCRPHSSSGGHPIQAELAVERAQAKDYQAILFVGGWGAASYQFASRERYLNPTYNGRPAMRAAVNGLIGDFLRQGKPVTAICHGVSVLAWARVDGVSPLKGHTVASWPGASPPAEGRTHPSTTRWEIEANGAKMVPAGSIGDPSTPNDDVVVDGQIITAESYFTGTAFGKAVAAKLTGGPKPR